MVTAMTLVQSVSRQLAVTSVPAFRTPKALRPAPAVYGTTPLFFGAVRLQKIRQTQTLLKLNRILGYGNSPLWAQVQYTPLSG